MGRAFKELNFVWKLEWKIELSRRFEGDSGLGFLEDVRDGCDLAVPRNGDGRSIRAGGRGENDQSLQSPITPCTKD